jgi:hypothetical protein
MERDTNGSDVNHCLQHSRTKGCNILKPHVTQTNMLQHLKSTVATLKKHVATSQIVTCNIKKNMLQHPEKHDATSQIDCCNTAKFKFMLSDIKHVTSKIDKEAR